MLSVILPTNDQVIEDQMHTLNVPKQLVVAFLKNLRGRTNFKWAPQKAIPPDEMRVKGVEK